MSKRLRHTLRDRFEGFSAPPPPEGWEQIASRLSLSFEDQVAQKIKGFESDIPSHTWPGIASQLPNSLESKIREKTSGLQPQTHHHNWEAIAQRTEQQPGAFEEALVSKLAHFQASVPRHLMHRVLSRGNSAYPFYWKRAITSVAAVFLLFMGFNLIPNQLNSPYINTAYQVDYPEESFFTKRANSESESIEYQGLITDLAQTTTIVPPNYREQSLALVNPANGNTANGNTTNGNTVNGAIDNYNVAITPPARKKWLVEKPDSAGALMLAELDVLKLATHLDTSVLVLGIHTLRTRKFELHQQEPPVQIGIKMSTGYFGVNSSAPANDPIYDRSFASFQNDLYQPGQFVTIGARITYAVNSVLGLVTGLDLSSAQQDQSFDLYTFDNYDSYESITNDGAVVTSTFNPNKNQLRQKRSMDEETREVLADLNLMPDSVMVGETYVITDHYLLADIPLGIEVDVYQFQTGSLGLSLGGKYRMVAGANTFHLTADRGAMVEVSPALSPAFYRSSVVATGGVWYKKPVGEHMELYIGPEININLSRLNQAHSWVSMRPLQVGLNVSLRQRLG